MKPQRQTTEHGISIDALSLDAATKSKLCYIATGNLVFGKAPPVWSHVHNNIRDITRSRIKYKLLTGTYTLQMNRAKFKQLDVSPTCTLCGLEDEDTVHFLTRCPALDETRTKCNGSAVDRQLQLSVVLFDSEPGFPHSLFVRLQLGSS